MKGRRASHAWSKSSSSEEREGERESERAGLLLLKENIYHLEREERAALSETEMWTLWC
jgi:hypothetical protein